ncbi:MAG TPA: methyltransferase domain-containing protein [Bacteroidales bacterium]|nr:methyltransferase domain-containing protein [Bacteroidales bacterium]
MNYEKMLVLKNRISHIDAGNFLDVAVGRGDFLKFAIESFHSSRSIAGIDNDPQQLMQAREVLSDKQVILVLASALEMPFTTGYFDTVTMSNALHHVDNLPKLFRETARICRKKGLVIVNEMLNENNTALDETYMLYHRLVSDIDNHQGHYHRDIYSLKELFSLVNIPEFQLTEYFIHSEETGEKMDMHEINEISDRLRRKVAQLKGSDYYYFYENKAREVINIFLKNGIHKPKHATLFIQVQ